MAVPETRTNDDKDMPRRATSPTRWQRGELLLKESSAPGCQWLRAEDEPLRGDPGQTAAVKAAGGAPANAANSELGTPAGSAFLCRKYQELARHHLVRLPTLFRELTGLLSHLCWAPPWPHPWSACDPYRGLAVVPGDAGGSPRKPGVLSPLPGRGLTPGRQKSQVGCRLTPRAQPGHRDRPGPSAND